MTNLTGQTLDGYRLLARLGEGGMGELEIWAGPKTTGIACANPGVLP